MCVKVRIRRCVYDLYEHSSSEKRVGVETGGREVERMCRPRRGRGGTETRGREFGRMCWSWRERDGLEI